MTVEYEGKIWQCLEAEHRTPGNKRAFVQAKMRSVMDGTQKEFKLSSTETLERIHLREREMQYLYGDGDAYHFMDLENYEQIQIGAQMLGNAVHYLLPDVHVQITFHDTSPIGVVLPATLNFRVIEAEPNLKSSTASSQFKNAKIETGLMIKVPQFVEVGGKIKIKTDTGEYVERVKED